LSRDQTIGQANLGAIVNGQQSLDPTLGGSNYTSMPGEGIDDGAWEALQSILFDTSNAFMSLQQSQPGMVSGLELMG
jgi:hypothetical protein